MTSQSRGEKWLRPVTRSVTPPEKRVPKLPLHRGRGAPIARNPRTERRLRTQRRRRHRAPCVHLERGPKDESVRGRSGADALGERPLCFPSGRRSAPRSRAPPSCRRIPTGWQCRMNRRGIPAPWASSSAASAVPHQAPPMVAAVGADGQGSTATILLLRKVGEGMHTRKRRAASCRSKRSAASA